MIILFWVSSAIDLCKLLKEKLESDEKFMEVLFDKVGSGLLFMYFVYSNCFHLHDVCSISLLDMLTTIFTEFIQVFSLIERSESNHLNTCLNLLSEIRDKIGTLPSQKCYDSLFCARADATDSE